MPGSRTSVESLGELGDRTISKVKRRVLPLIVFLYFIAFLDRNNVGFAKLTMSEDHGVGDERAHFLHHSVPAGRRGGRLLPGHHPVSDVVVPRPSAGRSPEGLH